MTAESAEPMERVTDGEWARWYASVRLLWPVVRRAAGQAAVQLAVGRIPRLKQSVSLQWPLRYEILVPSGDFCFSGGYLVPDHECQILVWECPGSASYNEQCLSRITHSEPAA